MTSTEESEVLVHGIEVNWHEGHIHDPTLKFLVEGLPNPRGPYERRALPDGDGSAAIYWTVCGGFASYFFWRGVPDDGFGGSRRTITLTDGSTEEVIGGWRVGPEYAASVGFPAVMDIAVVEGNGHGGDAWKRSGGLAYYVTVERARRELAIHRPDLELVPGRRGSSTVRRVAA